MSLRKISYDKYNQYFIKDTGNYIFFKLPCTCLKIRFRGVIVAYIKKNKDNNFLKNNKHLGFFSIIDYLIDINISHEIDGIKYILADKTIEHNEIVTFDKNHHIGIVDFIIEPDIDVPYFPVNSVAEVFIKDISDKSGRSIVDKDLYNMEFTLFFINE